MSNTKRVDPRETGKFSKPPLRRTSLSRLKHFERMARSRHQGREDGGKRIGASLAVMMSEIPGARRILSKRSMYESAMELALGPKRFSKKAEEVAVNATRKWKAGEFIGTRRMRALVEGEAVPNLEEVRAVFSAVGEEEHSCSTLAYLVRILHNAANPHLINPEAEKNTVVSRAAQECLGALEKTYAAKI